MKKVFGWLLMIPLMIFFLVFSWPLVPVLVFALALALTITFALKLIRDT